MILLHLGLDPVFGLMVPLPKEGLQIMLILKNMSSLAIKWLPLLITIDFMSPNLHNLLKMNDSQCVYYRDGQSFQGELTRQDCVISRSTNVKSFKKMR